VSTQLDTKAIKEKIDFLRTLYSQEQHRELFGASTHTSTHKFLLHPCITEKQVRQFEARHAIHLPEDYRNFLLEVGSGGAGPLYGLFSFGHFGERGLPELALPFPHSEHWNPQFKEGDTPVLSEFEDWYFDTKHIFGSMPICHEGCGYYDLLVVTGPEHGNVWVDARVSDGGICPLGVSFGPWYSKWLDECIEKLN